MLQPILVTLSTAGYRLIAGERRLRAAEMVGLERIPALVRSADEAAQLAWALIENLQRSDLNALEEARAFRQLIDEFGLSHEEVGARVGRSRSTVANTLRLLELDQRVQDALHGGDISEGHARALGGLADNQQQAEALDQIIARGLSVRQTEELVRRLRSTRLARQARHARAERRRRAAGTRPARSAGYQGDSEQRSKGGSDHDRVLRRGRPRADLRAADGQRTVTDRPVRRPPAQKEAAAGRRTKGASAAATTYTADSIQVLEGLEAVRRRPGMYIGSTDGRGLHHLIWEVVDNSIDEAMAGHATLIELTIKSDGSVVNRDNGRGVPVGKHKQTGRDALEVVHTVLHAGGKFGGGGYKVSGGLHGVGVSVVNALSEWLCVESSFEGKVWRQEYERGKPTTAVRAVGPSNGRTGTLTSFMADAQVFETVDWSFETIAQRLRESAYLNKGLWIKFVDERTDACTGEELLLRGWPDQLRAPPEQGPRRAPPAPDLRRAARRGDPDRGCHPVQRRLQRERVRVRQQHQHGRRRHPRDRLPRGADELAQRLRPAARRSSRIRTPTCRATTCAKG